MHQRLSRYLPLELGDEGQQRRLGQAGRTVLWLVQPLGPERGTHRSVLEPDRDPKVRAADVHVTRNPVALHGDLIRAGWTWMPSTRVPAAIRSAASA